MEFTIKKSSKDNLIQFIEWIKDRAEDPVHKNNKDLIADFLEQVVVVELKKLENDPQEFDTKVEIPDDAIPKQGPDPATLIRKVVKVLAEEMIDKDGNPVDVDEILNTVEEEEDDPQTVVPAVPEPKLDGMGGVCPTGEVLTASKGYNRTGNSHKKGKKRPLNADEREYITQEFLKKNGNLEDKDCTGIAKHLGLSVNGKTPWQVTGWVSELCRRVADGKIIINSNQSIPVPQFVPNPLKKRLK